MSKLFEALEKIEQQHTREPLLSSEKKILKKQPFRPYTTIFMVFTVLLATGGITLYYLNHHAKFLFLKAADIYDQKNATEQPGKLHPAEQPVIHEKNPPDLPQATTVKKSPVVFAKETVPVKTVPDSPELIPSSQQQSTPFCPAIVVSTPKKPDLHSPYQEKSTTLKKTVQQLLYQAEKRRQEGDMEGAVLLYDRAWKIKKSPATANNLAAGLITLKRFKKAGILLQKALEMAPDDPDLLYNIKLLNGEKRSTSHK